MRTASTAILAAGCVTVFCTAQAAHAEQFDVPPGRFGDVAAAVGAQAHITVAIPDPKVAGRRSGGVRGTMSVRTALAHIVRGADADIVFYNSRMVGIVGRPPPSRPARPPMPASPHRLVVSVPTDEAAAADIVVTASKQPTSLTNFPGSVRLVVLDRGWAARNGARGTAAITATMPILGATNLGPARNKLFIRGIADSSFNGPTQATVGQYLGDVRLNYNAPDPNLNLYDVQRIEVLTGPQGSLYGASSLGGIMRLEPNPPDMDHVSATASVGGSTTHLGGMGADGATMINLPVVAGRVALRLVTFAAHEPGYIDDPSRGLRNVNATTSYGQRMTLRITDLAEATVDLGVVIQNTSDEDGQYTLRGDPPLTRRTALPQPFDNTYYLGFLTARRTLGRAELVSTTSVVRHDLQTVFDATALYGSESTAQFQEDNHITLLSHETRVSGGGALAPWVAGVASIYNDSRSSRALEISGDQTYDSGVVNRQLELALFGQLSRPIAQTLTGTIGGRFTLSRSTGALIGDVARRDEPSRHDRRFSAMLALD